MKEFALKHPWMTFFLIDSAIAGVVNIVKCLTGYHDQVRTVTMPVTEDEGETSEEETV